ncbi:MAG: hypothetical protein WC798_00760 [Candidatus Paceibacterota bacterium]|jgi:hypothetical protein
MQVSQEKSKNVGYPTITLRDGNKPIPDAHILLIAENNTFFDEHTNEIGVCLFKNLPAKSYSIYIAHPSYPAHAIDGFSPDNDLNISVEKNDDIGSLICPNRTGYIPGLDGRLNPILDTSNRTYLYADNIAINGGTNQPATFEIGKPITLEDRNGVIMTVVFLRTKGDSSLLQYKKIEGNNFATPQQTGHIKGLVIEAGGSINNSGEILAHKDQFVVLRAAKDVNHSGKIKLSSGSDEKTFIERITNNQTAAIIIGGLILALVFYFIYRYAGVNLSNLQP